MGDSARKLIVVDDDPVDVRFVMRAFSDAGSPIEITHVADAEMAKEMGISSSTFYEWLKKHPEMSETVTRARTGADARAVADRGAGRAGRSRDAGDDSVPGAAAARCARSR